MRQKTDESTKKIQFSEDFSADCKFLMRELGLNISQFAEKMQISRAMLYAYLNGKKRITNRVWAKLRALKEEFATRPSGVPKEILQKSTNIKTRIQERYILATLDGIFGNIEKYLGTSNDKAVFSALSSMLGTILDMEMRTATFLRDVTPILSNNKDFDLLRDAEFLSAHLELAKNFTLTFMEYINNPTIESIVDF